MANPNINTLTDVFIPEGYGFGGYGGDGYGGGYRVLNPQWNTNSGIFGADPITGLSYVEATSTPSYVGASTYSIMFSSFFAKINIAPVGNGGIQTALIIKHDSYNYVEMSVGPNGVFTAYVSNSRNVTVPSSPMPAYDPVAHAFWRIRNDDGVLFHFDVSPDGSTWTELGSVSYSWDASAVTVTFFAGFTGIENAGNRANISRVNLPGTTLSLSGTARATSAARGLATLSPANALSMRVDAQANLSAKFKIVLGIPEGGITDFTWNPSLGLDTAFYSIYTDSGYVPYTGSNGATFTQGAWARSASAFSAPTYYRDGSYWPPAAYATLDINNFSIPDSGVVFTSSAQLERVPGLSSNRLSLDASIYANTSCYGAGPGTTSVTRSSDITLTGSFSGKILSSTSLATIGTGQLAYYPLPQRSAITPVIINGAGLEGISATVALSTTRANTNWFASLIYYDVNYNILSGSTFNNVTITNMNVHPGAGVWQTGNVSFPIASPAGAVGVAVVPVVIGPGSGTETVYMDTHFISGITAKVSSQPSAYTAPNNANINVKADRVNYALNAGFNVNTNFWTQTNVNTSGSPNPVTMSWDSTTGFNSLGSLKLAFVAPSGTFTGNVSTGQLGASTPGSFSGTAHVPIVQGLKVGHTYTISAWVKQGLGCPDVLMNFYDSNFLGMTGISTNAAKANGTVNGWTQVSITYTVPPNGLQDYSFYFYVKYGDYVLQPAFSFWIDSILVEESNTVNPFFDGGFAAFDYQWETGGSANNSRSYYYKDYNNKVNRLNSALSSVLPVGETYTLMFSQPIT